MINSKIVFRVATGIFVIVVIASLTLNYLDFKKTERQNQYVQSMVHQFKDYLYESSLRLGYHNGDPMDYPRAAAAIAAAGSELEALNAFEQGVNKQSAIMGYPPHADAIANFLSFISLSLENDSPVFLLPDGTKYELSRQQAKDLILEINDIFINNINDTFTAPNQINSMFNQIYNKIIPGVVKNQLSPILDFPSL